MRPASLGCPAPLCTIFFKWYYMFTLGKILQKDFPLFVFKLHFTESEQKKSSHVLKHQTSRIRKKLLYTFRILSSKELRAPGGSAGRWWDAEHWLRDDQGGHSVKGTWVPPGKTALGLPLFWELGLPFCTSVPQCHTKMSSKIYGHSAASGQFPPTEIKGTGRALLYTDSCL